MTRTTDKVGEPEIHLIIHWGINSLNEESHRVYDTIYTFFFLSLFQECRVEFTLPTCF